jgi:hypothetical protein
MQDGREAQAKASTAMAFTDAANIQSFCSDLGAADAAIQTQIDITNTSSALYMLTAARGIGYEYASASDFDNMFTFVTVMRNTEKSMTTVFQPTINTVAKSLDTYSIAVNGAKLRVQYRTGVTWTTAFKALWRRALSEEIMVRLGSGTKASNAWGSFTADQSISLASSLEVRSNPNAVIGSAAISLTIVLNGPSSSTSTQTVTIPANTVANTAFPLTGTWLSVASVTATGGTNADEYEIWVK